MAGVEVKGLNKSFGAFKALSDVSINFADGGFYGLLGPSGSGKTTLLRMIGGFDFPDSGQIMMGGEPVERIPVNKRKIGMVFQNYALFPNMSVAGNVAFGLSVRGVGKSEIKSQVGAALELVKLGHLANRRPHQLSGGQRQRVALARAVITRPRVLLLDEPLNALDKSLRVGMQIELKNIQREVGITTIFVTHDQEEALTLSDRMGILREGKVVQEGPPQDIYDRPQTEFAATFLGEANIFTGRVESGAVVLSDGSRVTCAGNLPTAGAEVKCAVRPERIRVEPAKSKPFPASDNSLSATIQRSVFEGSSSTYFVSWQGQSLKVRSQNSGAGQFVEGSVVNLSWSRNSSVLLF